MTLWPEWSKQGPQRRTKRVFDLLLAGSALLMVTPVLAVVGVVIRTQMGRPVLFRQTRPGFHGEPFELIKFRTMRPPDPGEVWFRSDVDRLTALGRLVRKSSLDELPSLWNVVRGDMSLVGPRPLLMEYLPKYTEAEMRRHEAPPGITGWAQIHGRQTVAFSRRLELDVWYVEHQSLRLDLMILVTTLFHALRSKGVQPGQSVDDVDDIGLSSDVERRWVRSDLG